MGVNWDFEALKSSVGLIKAFWCEWMCLLKKNIKDQTYVIRQPCVNKRVVVTETYNSVKISSTVHSYSEAWKSQDMCYYNSDCIIMKDESHLQIGRLEGE